MSRQARDEIGGPVVVMWWVMSCLTGCSVLKGSVMVGNSARSSSKVLRFPGEMCRAERRYLGADTLNCHTGDYIGEMVASLVNQKIVGGHLPPWDGVVE